MWVAWVSGLRVEWGVQGAGAVEAWWPCSDGAEGAGFSLEGAGGDGCGHPWGGMAGRFLMDSKFDDRGRMSDVRSPRVLKSEQQRDRGVEAVLL